MRVYDQVEFKKAVNSLDGEYKYCFEKIENYFRTCFCGTEQAEEVCLNQMLGEILSAQKIHKPLEMVIGSNLKKYCDKYMKLHQAHNASLIKFFKTAAIYMSFMLVIMLILAARQNHSLMTVSFGVLETIIVLYAFTWSIFRVWLLGNAISKNKNIKNLDMIINMLFMVVLLVVFNLGNAVTYSIPMPTLIPAALTIASYVGLIAVKRR